MIARVTQSQKQDGLWFRDDSRMIVRALLLLFDAYWMIVWFVHAVNDDDLGF